MRTSLRYVLTITVGAAIGLAAAVQTVRANAFGSNIGIGPRQTGRDFGTRDASAKTRAVVALQGLLALPAREARYYNAATDDAGQPLDGRCAYVVGGGALPARWWSLTLYDQAGYLAGSGPYSVESAGLARKLAAANKAGAGVPGGGPAPDHESGAWTIAVGPGAAVDLPTAGLERFALTLRLYLPADGGKGDPPRAIMPTITKRAC